MTTSIRRRPALETMLRLQAVCAKPRLVYRVIFSEAGEIDKWHGSVAERNHAPYTSVFAPEDWGKFKALCVSQFGADKLKDSGLSLYEAAAVAYCDAYERGRISASASTKRRRSRSIPSGVMSQIPCSRPPRWPLRLRFSRVHATRFSMRDSPPVTSS